MNRNKTLSLFVVCVLMLNTGTSYAGLFAKGGGESRTIKAITPSLFFNAIKQTMVLSGRFSKKQGRNRRVVISSDRLPTSFLVRVDKWKAKRISVTIPRALQPGRYHIFLQKVASIHNGQPQWRSISNKIAFEILDGSNVRGDGSPHAASIRVRNAESFCVGPPLKIRLSGGPFQRRGKPIDGIRAEVRATSIPVNRMIAPTIRIFSNTETVVWVERCQVIKNGAQIRLVYPDRSISNWVSIEQKISTSAGTRAR